MRRVLGCAVLAASCLQPAVQSAQGIVRRAAPFRPAPPQDRPADRRAPAMAPAPALAPPTPLLAAPLPPPLGRPDLFLAPPGTYAPRFDRIVPRRHHGFTIGYPNAAASYISSAPETAGRSTGPDGPRELPVGVLRLEVVSLEPSAPAALAAPVPGKPKTFYVIPGCYAGDRRPDKSRLPGNCDLRRLRVVPPM